LRRVPFFVVVVAALLGALPAAASLTPVRRSFGELQVARVRSGHIRLPAGHANGRIRVVVQLRGAPLARWSRGLSSTTTSSGRLDVSTSASRAYLVRLARSQAAAAAQLERAIPAAAVQQRYRILINGFAVGLPARDLPKLARLGFVGKVSPSVRYTLNTNESPAIIGAPQFQAATGMRGDGIKIGVVDDGVDPTNPYFSPAGFQYPAGFPRGGKKWTTPKIIVARTFPGPHAGRPGRLGVDPRASFHGTHVAGIAAGDAGTMAPAGRDHPATPGLSGVAPRAWIGNYRVFTEPTPGGNAANTPEVVAAFEAAAADGMDVVNFSGGGPETEPRNDALVDAVAGLTAAGVVPVISSGNDRDDFGFGTAGAPGTAPESIAVAAVSNTQVFAAGLRVTAAGRPDSLALIAFIAAGGVSVPAAWGSNAQTLVDVGTITGTDGRPVDRKLCGPANDPNGGGSTLPANSLSGAIALVSRGVCAFTSKADRARAAGAIGVVVADNRSGEANPIPVPLSRPGGMIADVDGARLRAFTAGSGGRTTVTIGRGAERIETGRGGVVTSFSSAGPTAFGHLLKPDLSAPGGQILSATLPIAGGPFAVFDGTSMAAPHVTGAATLLLQRHPSWTPRQVKSALMSTAGTAWADTARTAEAPVTLGGAGLVDIPAADDPKVFTEPSSFSFGDLDAHGGPATKALSVRISDAGGGGGAWQVEVRVQAATAGASLDVAGPIALAPGGETFLTVVARAPAGAAQGENYGFVLLRRGDVTRKVPYFFLVTNPGLADVPVVPLKTFQSGTTATGASKVDAYRYPTWAFGPPSDYGNEAGMDEDGAERLYSIDIDKPVANFGVSMLATEGGSLIDPWVLGSRDENDVQGAAGLPVNVNGYTFGYGADIGAAGAALPLPGKYYVSVDSGRDPFTHARLAGRYVMRSWVNDVDPPLILPVSTRVSAGRPIIVARTIDGLFTPESGVDPLELVIGYQGVLVGAAAYDPISGLALFPLPSQAPALKAGKRVILMLSSDYQEAKNTASLSENVLPNTSVAALRLNVVKGPAVTWLFPEVRECVAKRAPLVVTASSTAKVRSVRWFVDGHRIAVTRGGQASVYGTTWNRAGAKKGTHRLRSVVVDAMGRTAAARRTVRVCS
jgi:subtilisin family serine protease